MKGTTVPVGRVIKYTLSGGFIAMAFGVLGVTSAQAKLLDGDTTAKPQTRAAPAQAKTAPQVKDAPAKANPSRVQQVQKEKKFGTPVPNVKSPQRTEGDKKAEKDTAQRAPKNPIEDQNDRKLKALNARDKEREENNKRAKETGKGNVYLKSQDTGSAGKNTTPVNGLKALETGKEIEQAADKARERADQLARKRDKGPVGSIQTWKATAKLADEAETEAKRLEHIAGPRNKYFVPPPKPKPTIRRGYQQPAAPVSGPRAWEVKAEIAAGVEPAKDQAKALADLRDQQPEGTEARATLDGLVKTAKRNAAWLEYVDDAGKPVPQKIADSIGNDVQDVIKMGTAAMDVGAGSNLEKTQEKAQKKFATSAENARDSARELTDFKRTVRLPDGSIPPERQAELTEKRNALRTVAAQAADDFRASQQTAKITKTLKRVTSGMMTGVAAAYDLSQDKPWDEVAAGTAGGFVGGALGGRYGGAAGGFAGGVVGSAIVEETYKAIRDSGKDIDDIVNEAE
ncbi:hypothetical protein SAMN05421504_113128 [Amycolatopsis xylanica]|uniref:Uncharacterized protein n=1 Tax=Amycolatopsis xylanica TaxID=589385 RepID=A0A1H3SDX7_9PSEU|nr:hypothetical protein [Amycolatopsis xylanica]SDZ35805.1 hypothetical protein SAMN05421504_113128 [Amycolatopsis xylanica]